MRLEEEFRRKVADQQKSDATADAYWGWVERFMRYALKKRGVWVHPRDMGERQVEHFLSHLANDLDVSANTQNQAFSALCYLYREVLGRPLVGLKAKRAKRPDRIREVLSESDMIALLTELKGTPLLVAKLMYACGFRIGEVGRLRMKDICFDRKQIAVRGGKGEKDRLVGFPVELHDAVLRRMESMRVLWKHDVADGLNGVSLPKAFGRKSPKSHLAWPWWYLFAADRYSPCPKSGTMLRHHRDMGHVGRQIKEGADRAGLSKRVTSHCLRHSFCTHSLEQGIAIHVLQQLMGHTNLETTETYLHVTVDGATSAKSPIAALAQSLENPKSLKQAQPEKPVLRVYAG